MEEIYAGIGSVVSHDEFGDGVIVQEKGGFYIISFIKHGSKKIAKTYPKLVVISSVETPEDLISYSEVEKSLLAILKRFSLVNEVVEMGTKWIGGQIILKPGDSNLKSKEIPIDQFFHKIVMVRDRLRVMEQRINSSNLSDEEKLNLQQYITKIYGSLTTFNVLFKNSSDNFVGEKGD